MHKKDGAMPVLLLEKAYRARQEAALGKVRALGLKMGWIASQIGRARQWTSSVLNGSRYGEETLALIEDLLLRVEAGEVTVPPEARKTVRARKRGKERSRKPKWWAVWTPSQG